MKNVTLKHPQRVLDIDRTFALDTEAAITRHGQAIFQRLVQPLIDALDESFLGMLSHGPVIAHKQVPWRIQSEQRHRMETFLSQLGRKNAVVGQCVAINFAWCFGRQPPATCLIVAGIHLLVAFVAVKRPAPSLIRFISRRLQFRQPLQEHVDLKHGAFVRGIRLVQLADKPCQHVATKIYQEISRFDGLLFSILVKINCSLFPGQAERAKVDVCEYFRASVPRRLLQFAYYRTHAADRHLPFACFVTDKMINETTILQERRIAWMCQDTDFCIGENKTTDQIVF